MAAAITTVTPMRGAPNSEEKLKAYQREINFAKTGLVHTNWFELFTLDPGDSVVAIVAQVTVASTDAGSPTLDIGWDAGAELISAFAADAAGVFHMSATTPLGAATAVTKTICMSGNTATLTNGRVVVTALVLKGSDTSG